MRRAAVAALPVLGVALLLSGCVGGGGGLMAGQPLLSQPAAAPPPTSATMAVSLVGNDIGLGLTAGDKGIAAQAEYRALQFNQPGVAVTWQGTTPGVSGEVVPGARYTVNDYECRDYTHTIRQPAGTETGRGTACHEGDRPWAAVI